MSLNNGLAWLSIFALCVLPSVCVADPTNWPCQGRCIDAAWISDKGFAYFVKGNQFWRYDIPHGKVSFVENGAGYPRPIRIWPGLPQAWSAGIDAALNGGDGKVYWFKGRDYVRFDIAGTKVDAGPLPIAAQWPGLSQAWTGGFNAAVNWGNGKIYFFKGPEYLSYDLASGKATDPRPIAGNLRGFPEAWSTGIDTGVNWGNGKVYFFKGHEYIRYDIAGDRVDGGAPRPIASNWPGLLQLVDWVPSPAATTMPERAMAVGQEADGRVIFLCAAVVGNAVYPGKALSTSGCAYSDGQREQSASVFAIAATTLPIAWTANTSAASDRLIPVGNSPTGRPYYLCRGRFADRMHPGRLEDLSTGCTITEGGRSRSVNENVEVASAPTTVNFPYLPQLVSLLSPRPNSERFKNVCAPEVTSTVSDAAAGARYPRNFPDVKTLIQIIARNSCALLYKSPAEVPQYARKVDVRIEDDPKNHANAFVLRSDTHCTLTINPRVFPEAGPEPVGLLGLLYHEVTHTMQHSKASGRYVGAFNEGVADLIALKMLEIRVSKREGDWKGGYQAMAYFVDWLNARYSDFLYRYNMSRSRGPSWSVEVVRELTGKSIDVLWQEYQDSLSVTLPQPESLLKWSPIKTSDPTRNPAIPMQDDTMKRLLEKYDLLGTLAPNCAKPADKQNLYQVYRVLDGNRVERDTMSGPAIRDLTFVIDRAVELRPNEITISGTIENKRYDLIVRVESRRARTMESVREASERVVTGGRFTRNNEETPWYNKCVH